MSIIHHTPQLSVGITLCNTINSDAKKKSKRRKKIINFGEEDATAYDCFFYQSSLQQVVPTIEKGNIISAFLSLTLLVYCDRSQETSYAVLSSIIITLDDTIFLSFFLYFFSLLSVLLALLLFLYYYD